MPMWNPWHGCHKISEGCRHCYVYREDAAFGTPISTTEIRKTASFSLPLRRDRKKKLEVSVQNWICPVVLHPICSLKKPTTGVMRYGKSYVYAMIARFLFHKTYRAAGRMSSRWLGRRLRKCRHRMHCRESGQSRSTDAGFPFIADQTQTCHCRPMLERIIC